MIRKMISIHLDGETDDDILEAFNEVARLINDGCVAGFDSNESSGFTFNMMESKS